jgi:hypothetical protein
VYKLEVEMFGPGRERCWREELKAEVQFNERDSLFLLGAGKSRAEVNRPRVVRWDNRQIGPANAYHTDSRHYLGYLVGKQRLLSRVVRTGAKCGNTA